jgi:hypothetical protein
MKSVLFALVAFLFLLPESMEGQTFYAHFDPAPGGPTYFGGFQRILPTPDSGFVALSGTYERTIAKFDAEMNLEWAKRFDTPGGQTHFGVYDMTISHDEKILVLGFGGGTAALSFVVKMELDGTVIWKKDIASDYLSCGYYLNGKQIMNAHDNGFFVVGGTSDGKSMLLRMDASGNAVWAKVFNDLDDTFSQRFNFGLLETNNAYFLQSTMSTLTYVTIQDNGIVTSRIHHSNGWVNTYPKLLMKASSGDYYAVGLAYEPSFNTKHQLLAKMNSSAGLEWVKLLSPDTALVMYEPYGLVELPNGQISVQGYVSTQGGAGSKTQISRFDPSGNHLETKIGWNSGVEKIYGASIHNGDLYLAGYSSSGDKNFLARVDGTGEGICNSQTIPMLTSDITNTFSVANDSVTEAFMPTTITNSTWEVVPHSFIRTVDCGNTLLAVEPSSMDPDYRVVPQPSSGRFTIHHPAATDGTWKLTALDGKVVARGGITPGATATAIQEQGLPAGLYWMELQREDHITYLRVSIGK